MNKVRWGILGTADIACARVIPAIGETSMARTVAIASRDEGKARRAAAAGGIDKAYGNYESLLADDEIEAVYIPLPNHLHVEWTIRAMEAGKHVLCEKPLCLTSIDARALIQARQRAGVHLEEGLAFRNHPQWAFIDELLASGEIGQPKGVQAMIAKQFLDPEDIRNKPDLGGGSAYDLAIYPISACNLVFRRPPVRVVAAMEIDPEFGIDRLTTALLDYGDGHATLTAASQAGTAAWATHQQFSVLGSAGWLRCDFPYAQARPSPCNVEIGTLESVGSIATRTVSFSPVNQYALQMERFSRAVRGEQVRTWPVTEALMNLRIIEGMFESAKSSSWVRIGE